jgi:hypothetical protein
MAIEFDIQVRNGTVKITVGGQSSSQNTGGDGKNSGTGTGGDGKNSGTGTGGDGSGAGCSGPVVIGPIVISGSLLGTGTGTGGDGKNSGTGTGGDGKNSGTGTGGDGKNSGTGTGGDGKNSGTGTGGDGKNSGTGTGGSGTGGGCCCPVVIGPIVISDCCSGQGDPAAGHTGSRAVTVNPPPGIVNPVTWPFTMQPQQETYWCWAAVAVSINDFLNPPGLAAGFTQSTLATQLLEQQGITAPDCSETPGSTVCNQPQRLDVALTITGNLRQDGALSKQHLTFDCIQDWMNAQLPVGARIKWRGVGAHFIALSGCKVMSSGQRMVLVQDPNTSPTCLGFIDYDTVVEDYQQAGYWDDTYLVIASNSKS